MCTYKITYFLCFLSFCGSVKLPIDISPVLWVERASPCYVRNVAGGSLCLALHQGNALSFFKQNVIWMLYVILSTSFPEGLKLWSADFSKQLIAAQENVKIDTL